MSLFFLLLIENEQTSVSTFEFILKKRTIEQFNIMKQDISLAQEVFDIEAAAILDLKKQLTQDFSDTIQEILECQGKVVICGMGKSGLIGKKIAATLASTGTPSFFMHPAEAFHGDLGMITSNDIFIGISNSGETEELIKLIPSIKRNGNKFVAMCGKSNATLVRNADYFLDVSVQKEACPLALAPTSSTTATLAMGDALAVVLMEKRNFQPEQFAMFHPGGSLGRKLLTKVQDVMQTQNIPKVQTDTSFKDLIFTMTDGKLGLALVLENQKLVGLVSDGDLRRAWKNFENLGNKTVADIMSKNPKTISPEMMLVDAEKILLDNKITCLIVAKEDKIIGVLQLYAI